MVACNACATESPDGFRFCPACGAALAAQPAGQPAAAPAGERKAVTALFCDLVGFTSVSESADPEDVDRMLAAYFALARHEIEHHGGTVEKFIGDAVVGMFGAPSTHEDDPERAVRAALRIADSARQLTTAGGAPLKLRIGINTGETLVHVGAAAAKGEAFVVGDAINTAARIQSVAPEMGVAVGLSTWESTYLAIDYEELPPATLKGKSEPVRVFHATAVRASIGVDLSRSHTGAFVGRADEIDRLRAVFDHATEAGQARFVAVVGEPGIGKSRITAELAARILGDDPGVAWRQGRCLPYGDGVTFWALGEILKAHAGILDGDDTESVIAKVEDAIPAAADTEWLRDRLLPLVGAAPPSADREESFGAWRAFLEGIARANPAVIVFEDIHWADEVLLAFLAHLAANPPDAPLLILMTARPTLDERQPAFAGSMRGLERVDLEPLTDDETERLITGILGAVVPHELHQPIIDRAQGNPLYAEEFVRLLVDRGLLVRSKGTFVLREGATIPMPDSITSLLAARLDALPSGRKTLLADAAVIGKVFWSGAVAAMEGRTTDDVDTDLADLARIELVRPAARSSMTGEAEYAFWHVLARDVAYQQLPRATRAARHQAAGDWLEAKAGERVEDVVQLLAHHYSTALDLARAAGEQERAEAIEPPARRYLRMAGERAIGLDTAAAVSFLERALALASPGDPERPQILAAFAVAADQAARHEDAAGAFEEAIAGFEAQGDRRAAARAMLRLHLVYVATRDPRDQGLAPRALEFLTSVEPSEDLVTALTEQGVQSMFETDFERALEQFDRALAVADEIGMPPPGRTLRRRGHLRLSLGDRGGLVDCERAIEAARTAGDAREASIGSLWYAGQIAGIEGYGHALPVLADGLEHARTRGLASMVQTLESGIAGYSVDAGSFDDAMARAQQTLVDARASGADTIVAECLYALICVLTIRGELDELPDALYELTALNPTYGVDDLWPDLQAVMAEANLALGRRDEAADVIRRVLATPDVKISGYVYLVGRFTRVATELGLDTDAMLDGVKSQYPIEIAARRWAEAIIAESHGDPVGAATAYEQAVDGYRSLGAPPWEAINGLGLGRSLAALGRRHEADAAVGAARAVFERLRATPWIAECDLLLDPTTPTGSRAAR